MILKSNYEEIERKYRIDFWIGIGTATWLIAIFSTVLGFYAADFLSKDMIIGLAIVNPIYFMCAMIGVMKTIQLSSAIILGALFIKFFILDFESGLSNPPNSTVPTTLKPCSIGVIPKPLLEKITGLDNK